MLQINRLKIRIVSSKKEYSFDETFNSGLNFIASDDNTRGKSSVLIAIYYCLGFEEIIGGRGEKVLTSAYKTQIEDGGENWPVLESGAYLEITNGHDVITIYRSAKHETRDSKLITVYFSELSEIFNDDTMIDEYYVHSKNSAQNQKGFHHFLEEFLELKLPLVPTADGADRKLYLQLIFSSMLIEQKNGWNSIYSGMPYLAIQNPKKRVTEFVIGLNTFENERKRNELANKERYQKDRWNLLYKELGTLQQRSQCFVKNIPSAPEILQDSFADNVKIVRNVGDRINIDDWVEELQKEHDSLKTVKPKVIDNFDELQNELNQVESDLSDYQELAGELSRLIQIERRKITSLNSNMEVLNQDIANNKDAEKLQRLGSNLQGKSFSGTCPTCNQKIADSLLPVLHETATMSITQTIKHLEAQKKMVEFALNSHRERITELENQLQSVRSNVATLYRLGKTIRRDLYSIDEDLSETIIYKRMEIERHITDLKDFRNEVDTFVQQFIHMSDEWKALLEEKAKLPKKGIADADETKVHALEENFKDNLKRFNYTSTSNIAGIKISRDNYMPIIDNFDMKFDSSASDNIRAIWAYTLALLQTSLKTEGNHPGLIIFDEPAQHSIGAEDAKALFDTIVSLSKNSQIIIGITINSKEIEHAIEQLETKNYKYIHIGEKAFV